MFSSSFLIVKILLLSPTYLSKFKRPDFGFFAQFVIFVNWNKTFGSELNFSKVEKYYVSKRKQNFVSEDSPKTKLLNIIFNC